MFNTKKKYTSSLLAVSLLFAIPVAVSAQEAASRGALASAIMSDEFAASTGLDVRGWVSGGATWNTTNDSGDYNGPVTFNDRADQGQLDQIYLITEKKITVGADDFDLGGRVDVAYGADGQFMQSIGFDDNLYGLSSPTNQVAIPQAYLETNLPVGDGLALKVGHFYTLLGYEVATASDNFFYSRSYSSQYAEPVTHWGALATYNFCDLATVTAGLTRGWDNLTDKADGNLAFLGSVSFKATDDTGVVFALTTGNQGHDQNLTAYSIVATTALSESLTHVLQHDLGNYDLEGGSKSWYTLGNYLLYTIDDATKVGTRLEWFNDADGSRVAGLRSGSAAAEADYFGLTVGTQHKLTSYLSFRPEVRYDWQTGVGSGDRAFNGDKNQLLVSANLILNF